MVAGCVVYAIRVRDSSERSRWLLVDPWVDAVDWSGREGLDVHGFTDQRPAGPVRRLAPHGALDAYLARHRLSPEPAWESEEALLLGAQVEMELARRLDEPGALDFVQQADLLRELWQQRAALRREFATLSPLAKALEERFDGWMERYRAIYAASSVLAGLRQWRELPGYDVPLPAAEARAREELARCAATAAEISACQVASEQRSPSVWHWDQDWGY